MPRRQQTHRVVLEADAMVLLDRRGEFHPDWYLPGPVDSAPGK